MSDRHWRNGLIAVGIIALFLHFDAINNGMVFDDHLAVQNNKVLLDGFDAHRILVSRFWGDNEDFSIAAWRPLVTLTYALNHAVHGTAPAGYHLVNLILHALVAVLVALSAETLGLTRIGALLAALLFAVHPIHVEAVVPIVGRADLMLGLFGLGAILLWEKQRYLKALLCLGSALYSKEMGVVVAGVMVWRSFIQNGFPKKPKGYVWALPMVVVGFWLVSRLWVLGDLGERDVGFLENPLADASFSTRFWTMGTLYAKLLGLMVFPKTLLREYSYAAIVPNDGATLLSVVGLLLLLMSAAFVFLTAKHHSKLSAASALWTGGFLLVSHLGPTLPMIFAERVFYLPSAGLFIALVLTAEKKCTERTAEWVLYAVFIIFISAFGVRSVFRVGDWVDDQTLVRVSLEDAPDCIKNIIHAVVLLRPNGLLSDAESERLVKRAVALREDHPLAHVEAAKLFVILDRRKEALYHIERATQLESGQASLESVQCAYASKYALSSALAVCQAAVKKKPNDPSNWSFLAITFDKLGKTAEAEATFRKALDKMGTPRADILLNFGVFLASHGHYAPAEKLFRAVLEINAEDKGARQFLKEIQKINNVSAHPNR